MWKQYQNCGMLMLPRSAVRATQVLCLITNISAHCCIAPTLLLPPHFSFPKAGPATLPVELLLFSTVMRWVESEPQPLILWKQDPFSSGAGRKRGVQPGASGDACGYSHTSHRQGEGIPILQRSKKGKGKHFIQQFLPHWGPSGEILASPGLPADLSGEKDEGQPYSITA